MIPPTNPPENGAYDVVEIMTFRADSNHGKYYHEWRGAVTELWEPPSWPPEALIWRDVIDRVVQLHEAGRLPGLIPSVWQHESYHVLIVFRGVPFLNVSKAAEIALQKAQQEAAR